MIIIVSTNPLRGRKAPDFFSLFCRFERNFKFDFFQHWVFVEDIFIENSSDLIRLTFFECKFVQKTLSSKSVRVIFEKNVFVQALGTQ